MASFCGCKSLTDVLIPKSVNYIDYHAFAECPSLKIFVEKDTAISEFDTCWNGSCRVYEYGSERLLKEPVIDKYALNEE